MGMQEPILEPKQGLLPPFFDGIMIIPFNTFGETMAWR
jgi:hypothetical protein